MLSLVSSSSVNKAYLSAFYQNWLTNNIYAIPLISKCRFSTDRIKKGLVFNVYYLYGLHFPDKKRITTLYLILIESLREAIKQALATGN